MLTYITMDRWLQVGDVFTSPNWDAWQNGLVLEMEQQNSIGYPILNYKIYWFETNDIINWSVEPSEMKYLRLICELEGSELK